MASSQVTGTLDQFPGQVTTLKVVLTDATDHLTTAITATGGTDFVEIAGFRAVSIGVVNGATTGVTFTVEGSSDGTNFVTAAYGQGSSAAYTQAALTLAASAKTVLLLPSSDYFPFIRVNISSGNSTNGTTFTLNGQS